MQQTKPAPLSREVTHVPLWVKGILAVCAILFAVRIPDFKSSLR